MVHLLNEHYLTETNAPYAPASIVSFALSRLMLSSQKSGYLADKAPLTQIPITTAELIRESKKLERSQVTLHGMLRFVKSYSWLTVNRGASALHTELSYDFTDSSEVTLHVVDFHKLYSCETLISSRDFARRYRLHDGTYQVSGMVKNMKDTRDLYLSLERFARIEE